MPCRPDRWLLGLPLLLALLGGAAWHATPRIENGLRDAAAARLAGLREDLRPVVLGRDVLVAADAELGPAAATVRVALQGLPAVRRVAERVVPPSSLEPFVLSVERQGSTVILSGGTPPGPARAELVAAARALPGVERVDDAGLRSASGAPAGFLEVARSVIGAAGPLPGGRIALVDRTVSVSGAAPDSPSYEAVAAAFRRLPAGYAGRLDDLLPPVASPYGWSVRLEGGRYILGGEVPSEAARARLVAAARRAESGEGHEPVDRMRTARGLDGRVDFDALTAAALSWLSRLETGVVRLDGTALSVEGGTPARDLLDAVREAVERQRPAGTTLGAIELRPVPASPYRFRASRSGGRLLLTGYAPSADGRGSLVDAAARRFPFERVVSELHVAEGAPEAMLQAADRALSRLAVMQEGDVTLVDRAIAIRGRVLYPELAARSRRDAALGFPAGWTVTAEIREPEPEKALDPGQCGDLLADAGGREPIRFEAGQAELGPAARKAIGPVADILRRCAGRRVRIVATAEAAGDPEAGLALARRRAAAVGAVLAPEIPRFDFAPEGAVRPAGTSPGKPVGDAVAFEVQP